MVQEVEQEDRRNEDADHQVVVGKWIGRIPHVMDTQEVDAEPRDRSGARRSTGDGHPVIGEYVDYLTESERHDGEIVTAQAQRGETEQHASQHRNDHRERYDQEGVQVKGWLERQSSREIGSDVGTERVE